MTKRSIPAIAAAVALTLTACGASDSATSSNPPIATTPEPPVSAAPPATDTATVESTQVPTTDTEAAPAEPSETAAPVDTQAAAPEPAPLGGRDLGVEVEPEALFAGNPFPDLVVDDVRRGTQVNLANVLPSDRPVLVWAWAPH